MFLVLSYTHISISSLGWLSLSGSWSLPALQVPSVTRTTPTYWARLHSPVNYQTGVSFCSSYANPFSASLSYWAVVLSRDLALFLHRHHMNRISCGNLNRLLSTLRWLPWSLIAIRHLLLRSIGTMYGPTPVIVAIHLSVPFHYEAVIFCRGFRSFLSELTSDAVLL